MLLSKSTRGVQLRQRPLLGEMRENPEEFTKTLWLLTQEATQGEILASRPLKCLIACLATTPFVLVATHPFERFLRLGNGAVDDFRHGWGVIHQSGALTEGQDASLDVAVGAALLEGVESDGHTGHLD